MPLYESGPTTQYNSLNAGAIPNDLFPIAINWFPNRTPVIARFPKVPVNSPHITLFNDDYRARSFATTGAFSGTGDTTLTIADTSQLDVGDVIEVETERIQVTAIASATTATVTRGYEGTTAAAHASGVTARLITNARTGAEINQTGLSRIPSPVTQYCQTVQHAYGVGGALQADGNFMGGAMTPLDRDRMMAMQHAMDDTEVAIYRGKGQAVSSATARPAMKGFDALITTNRVTAPTNAGNYKVSDLIRDTVSNSFSGGGQPDLLLVSSGFLGGFAVWGNQLQRMNAGQTAFGVAIDLFYAPFLEGGMRVIPCPLLDKAFGSDVAIALTASEVKVGIKRTMIDKPRGSRGDADEGDIIMETTLVLGNQAHHAMVSGITGFAAG